MQEYAPPYYISVSLRFNKTEAEINKKHSEWGFSSYA